MQIKEALELCIGDQVQILTDNDTFTVVIPPAIKGKGVRAFARITARDTFGITRIFSNDELARIHKRSKYLSL